MEKIPFFGGPGIPALGSTQVRISTVPFLELVGSIVQLIRSRITSKSKNSFLYIASDGKSATFGRAGQEEDIILGIINVLKSDETTRKYVMDYFNNKFKEEQNGSK